MRTTDGLARAATESMTGPRQDLLIAWSRPGPDEVPRGTHKGHHRDLIGASRGTAHADGLVGASAGPFVGRSLALKRPPADLRVAAAVVVVTRHNAFSRTGAEVEQRQIGSSMVPLVDRRQAVVPPARPRTFGAQRRTSYGVKTNHRQAWFLTVEVS